MSSATVASAVPARFSGWQWASAAFAVAVAVLLGCYWQTVQSLVHVWSHDGTYQYAFLIFPISVWTAWGLRESVRSRAPAPSIWGLVAVTALVCIWYAGHAFAVNLPQHFALVAMFPALVLACWGWWALWVLKFPLAYLVVFAVPWGNAMVGPLQDITAHLAVGALNLVGTPVLLNGREIMTPSATWMVADACSGVKFFIACTALGCLYAYLMYQRMWKRVLFVLLAAVVPIIANGLRVFFTVLIGETWGLQYATGTDHMVFGWQFFGTVLIVLLLIGWFFRDRLPPRQALSSSTGRAGIRAAFWPAAMALLVAGPVLAMALHVAGSFHSVHLAAPRLAQWNGPRPATTRWRPSFTGAAGEVRAAYEPVADGPVVELFHAVYTGRPRRGHSLVTYGNDVYDHARARVLASRTRSLELAGDRVVHARELRMVDASGPRLVWYWYCVDDHCTSSPMLTKLLRGWAIMRGHPAASSVWALSSRVSRGNFKRARTRLRSFSRALPLAVPRTPNRSRAQVAAGGAP